MLRRAATISAAIVVSLAAVDVARAEPVDCVVRDTVGQCLIAAADPGRPGGPQFRPHPPVTPRISVGEAEPSSVPQPPAAPEPLQMRLTGGLGRSGMVLGRAKSPDLLIPPAIPPLPDVVQPNLTAVATQRAVELLRLQPPSIRVSAASIGFVGMPLWLWIDRGQQFTGPVTATAVAGAAQVTATGRLVEVDWAMGPAGAEVRCVGPGTPWTGQRGASPDCGYVYAQRSLPERTNGTGRWSITATSVWQVEWAGTTGGVPVAGGQEVRVAAQTTLTVGEVQVLVAGGGGQ